MGAIDEVKARADIVEVIGQYVPLKKAGRNYKALCPFHSEKTPSFYVFPHTQTWHCFGCNTGGDVFSFVMKREGLDFREALKLLAEKVGVRLEERPPKEMERERLLREVNSVAADYYHRVLFHPERGFKAREYLEKRGVSEEAIKVFKLGYAPAEWHGLEEFMVNLGYKREIIYEAGLIVKREDGSFYDRFRDRLMIPIRDEAGRIAGFGGRTLDPEGVPKYINSPATPIFDKSRILFGLDIAKEAIKEQDMAIIVEGYFDVIQAHQRGYRNVVASMGTSITEAQLRLLSRYTRRFAFALDPDIAGSEATIRALQMAEEVLDKETQPAFDPRGFIRFEERLNAEIFILSLPPGRDPDDLIRESPKEWQEVLEKATPVAEFFIQLLSRKFDLSSPKGKAEAVRTIVPILRAIKDEVEREHYIYRLARIIKIDEGVIRRELGSVVRSRIQVQAQRQVPKTALGLEEYALARFMENPELLSFLDKKMTAMGLYPLSEADFSESETRILFSLWKAALDKDGGRLEDFLESLDPILKERAFAILEKAGSAPQTPLEKAEDEILYCALRMREQSIRYYLQELKFLQEEAREQGDEESLNYYRGLIKAHAEELASLHRAMSRYSYRKRGV